MSLQKKSLDIEKKLRHYTQFKDKYQKNLMKITLLAYIHSLKISPNPINKKQLRDHMRLYLQEYMKRQYNQNGLKPYEVGAISGTINLYESKRKLEPHHIFLAKLETLVKKIEENDNI